jgi:hypothetical protein
VGQDAILRRVVNPPNAPIANRRQVFQPAHGGFSNLPYKLKLALK